MTKTLVLSRYRNTALQLKNNLPIIIIMSIFLFGLIVGSFSISVCDTDDFYGIENYFLNYITLVEKSTYIDIFLKLFFGFCLLILINYVLGLCVVGNFISLVILFVFSFGIGSISGYLYRVFSVNGIGFFALSILPGMFLFCVDYMLSLKHSLSNSKELFNLVKKERNVKMDFKNYSLKFLIHFILVLIISFVSAFFINTFSSMFNFT